MTRKTTFTKLKKKLLKRKQAFLDDLEEKHQEATGWVKEHKKDINSLSHDLVETAATSAATGILLLASGSLPFRSGEFSNNQPVTEASQTISTTKLGSSEDISALLAEKLEKLIPRKPKDLSEPELESILKTINETLAIEAKAKTNGYELNTSYGYIGGEQHLYRFPGDSLIKHIRDAREWFMYGRAGIAPNRGAWGYFPNEEFERYYVAIQTFLSPNWQQNPKAAYDWFRFRKVLVVNPETGESVVAVVGDAGPAEWTGKHFGGSPEVMHYLGLGSGSRKGGVFMFFIDDPEGKVPLGPVTKKFAS